MVWNLRWCHFGGAVLAKRGHFDTGKRGIFVKILQRKRRFRWCHFGTIWQENGEKIDDSDVRNFITHPAISIKFSGKFWEKIGKIWKNLEKFSRKV